MTRLPSIDALKFLLALGVVWAHSVLIGQHFSTATYLFGQGLVRAAVPTFALVSGFLFHATSRRGRTWPWLMIMTFAYLMWCLIYAPVWILDEHDLLHVLGRLVVGPLHLWYMAALIVAVLMIAAVVRLIPDPLAQRRWLLGSAVALLFTGATLQGIDFFTPLDLPLNVYRNGIFVEYPYAALGFLLAAKIQRDGRDWMPGALPLWLLLGLLAALRLGEAWLSLKAFGLSPAAPPEFPPLAMAFSVTLMMAMLRLDLPDWTRRLGKLSMALYFLHYLVLLGALSLGLTSMGAMMVLGVAGPVLLTLLGRLLWREVRRFLRQRQDTDEAWARPDWRR